MVGLNFFFFGFRIVFFSEGDDFCDFCVLEIFVERTEFLSYCGNYKGLGLFD